MRTLPPVLQQIINDGIFVGDRRANGYVTVEPDWYLMTQPRGGGRERMADPASPGSYTPTMVRMLFSHYDFCTNEEIAAAIFAPVIIETAEERITRITGELNSGARSWGNVQTSVANLPPAVLDLGALPQEKRPIRWWQRLANDQIEIPIPNVTSIEIDRNVDNAAGSVTVTIINQQMNSNVAGFLPAELGQPGYFSPERGRSRDARHRWGHQKNPWRNVLVQNAMIRTYQGYGGNDLSLEDALVAGHVVLTGVWLIDKPRFATDKKIVLTGRDPIKLLIEQQLFPPLVPRASYPLVYERWHYDSVSINAGTVTTTTPGTPGDVSVGYSDSSSDRWYGPDATIHGHKPTDSLDGNIDSYWLSVGNSGQDAPFATDWIEYNVGGDLNAVEVTPWGGGYQVYISVMENGVWQGDPNVLIPYDPSILFATQDPAVDTGAAIPYVSLDTSPWEEAKEYLLPRTYHADKVRVTFRHHVESQWGPWYWRAGVREFKARISAAGNTDGATSTLAPWTLGGESHLSSGYWTVSRFGQVDAFGGARIYPLVDGQTPPVSTIPSFAVRATPSNLGYYILDHDGKVTAYGDAVHQGDNVGDGFACTDMALTVSGAGYWILHSDGSVHGFGDAGVVANVTIGTGVQAFSIENDGSDGLWILDTNGTVTPRLGATDHGSFDPLFTPPPTPETSVACAHRLRGTSTGGGYWILTSHGRVQAFGDADFFGEAADENSPDWGHRYWGIMPAADDLGYVIVRGDGTVQPFGTVDYYGGPMEGGQAQVRRKGNYEDYSDIVRDLALWSGFWLRGSVTDGRPDVYGNIEQTGAYSKDPFPTDFFDKRPPIDAINAIKEIVGYIIFCDEEGALHFESPNWWAPGNFNEFGQHTEEIPEIDERIDMFAHGVELNDDVLRSDIYISSEKIDFETHSAQFTRFTPNTAKLLRGMCKPLIFTNGYYTNTEEQRISAELIALHIFFKMRAAQTEALCNPAIQVNDQIRAIERVTSDMYTYYVRGLRTTMDLQNGTWKMSVTTNWLGDVDDWAITPGSLGGGNIGVFEDDVETDPEGQYFTVSAGTRRYLSGRDTSGSLAPSRLTAPLTLAAPITDPTEGVGSGPLSTWLLYPLPTLYPLEDLYPNG